MRIILFAVFGFLCQHFNLKTKEMLILLAVVLGIALTN